MQDRSKNTMKKIQLYLVLIACVGMGITLLVCPVSAGTTKHIPLKEGKKYSSYDFTRDGKKDTFKYTCSKANGIGTYNFYINGKRLLSVKSSRGTYCYLYYINKKKSYLIVESNFAGGASTSRLYYYKNKKLIQVPGNINKLYSNYVEKVYGNDMYVLSGAKYELQSFNCGPGRNNDLLFKTEYRVYDSGIKAVSQCGVFKGSKHYYGLNTFYTSKSLSKLSVKDGPLVKQGQEVYVLKIAFLSSERYAYLIKVNGKQGWFLDSKTRRLTTAVPKTCITVSTGICGGQKLKVTASCNTGEKVTWKSTDSSIANVSGGYIIAKKPGTAVLTAYVTRNGKVYSTKKTVTVKERTAYGNWSNWSFTPQNTTANQQVETAVFYRYYCFLCPCFLCPVCGGREPFQGISDCHQYSLSMSNALATWSTVSYQSCSSAVYSYSSAKRYTYSLGDGKRWNFSSGNLWDTAPGTKDAAGPDAVVIKTGYRSRQINRSYYISSIK
ncbi:MAG: hypothetical protein SOY73_06375 [Blautia sp.]|nr:hypothetical protein [Blautia sp.]